MTSLFENLATKVQAKMTERNISNEDLLASAGKLQEGLMKSVSKMPGGSQIKRMIKNMDLQKMGQQMMQGDVSNETSELSPEQFMQQMMSGVDSSVFQNNQSNNTSDVELAQAFKMLGIEDKEETIEDKE
jgi:hypothetical protein